MNTINTQFAAIHAAARGVAKIATLIKKLCERKRRAQVEKIRDACYADLLNGRKVKELSEDDRRAYDAERTAFSRYIQKTFGGKKPTGKKKSAQEVKHAAILAWFDEQIEALQGFKGATDFSLADAIKGLKTSRAQFNLLKTGADALDAAMKK